MKNSLEKEFAEQQGRRAIELKIQGPLNHDAWEYVCPLIPKMVVNPIRILRLDLQLVDEIDSAGLGLLEFLQQVFEANGGSLLLLNPQQQFQDYLRHQKYLIVE